MDKENIDDLVYRSRAVSDQLLRYGTSSNDEFSQITRSLRDLSFIIDGYPVLAHFTKSRAGDNIIEYLQIQPTLSEFLPFNVVFKIAQKFMGSRNLSYTEVYKGGKKVYFWILSVTEDGKPVELEGLEDYEEMEYNGIKYNHVNSSQIEFY